MITFLTATIVWLIGFTLNFFYYMSIPLSKYKRYKTSDQLWRRNFWWAVICVVGTVVFLISSY